MRVTYFKKSLNYWLSYVYSSLTSAHHFSKFLTYISKWSKMWFTSFPMLSTVWLFLLFKSVSMPWMSYLLDSSWSVRKTSQEIACQAEQASQRQIPSLDFLTRSKQTAGSLSKAVFAFSPKFHLDGFSFLCLLSHFASAILNVLLIVSGRFFGVT